MEIKRTLQSATGGTALRVMVYRGDSAAVKQWPMKSPPPTPECPPTSTDALISPVD
jgi:hypothetical protein